MYIYIYIYTLLYIAPTSVCEKNTPLEEGALGKIGLRKAKTGAGTQFVPFFPWVAWPRLARKGVLPFMFADTGITSRGEKVALGPPASE